MCVTVTAGLFGQSVFFNIPALHDTNGVFAFDFPGLEWVSRCKYLRNGHKACNREESSGQMGDARSSFEMEKLSTRVEAAVSIVLGVNAKSGQLGAEGKTGQCRTGREILAA